MSLSKIVKNLRDKLAEEERLKKRKDITIANLETQVRELKEKNDNLKRANTKIKNE